MHIEDILFVLIQLSIPIGYLLYLIKKYNSKSAIFDPVFIFLVVLMVYSINPVFGLFISNFLPMGFDPEIHYIFHKHEIYNLYFMICFLSLFSVMLGGIISNKIFLGNILPNSLKKTKILFKINFSSKYILCIIFLVILVALFFPDLLIPGHRLYFFNISNNSFNYIYKEIYYLFLIYLFMISINFVYKNKFFKYIAYVLVLLIPYCFYINGERLYLAIIICYLFFNLYKIFLSENKSVFTSFISLLFFLILFYIFFTFISLIRSGSDVSFSNFTSISFAKIFFYGEFSVSHNLLLLISSQLNNLQFPDFNFLEQLKIFIPRSFVDRPLPMTEVFQKFFFPEHYYSGYGSGLFFPMEGYLYFGLKGVVLFGMAFSFFISFVHKLIKILIDSDDTFYNGLYFSLFIVYLVIMTIRSNSLIGIRLFLYSFAIFLCFIIISNIFLFFVRFLKSYFKQ